MKIKYTSLIELLPGLSWPKEMLAEKLSTIGHETVVVGEDIHVTLTANRKDCRELPYLAYDLSGIYPELGSNAELISFQMGRPIAVTIADVNKLLGTDISQRQYRQLEQLGFEVKDESVTPPDFRIDINQKADISEEVLRIVGFEKILLKELSKEPVPDSDEFMKQQSIKMALTAAGLTETATYSFTQVGQVELKNPFNDSERFLRPDLTDGLLKTLARNPYLKRCGFFEIGNVFLPDETTHLGIILSGFKDPQLQIEKLKQTLGVDLTFQPTAQAELDNKHVKQTRVVIAEIAIKDISLGETAFTALSRLPIIKPISKYPPLIRDVTVDESKESNLKEKLISQPRLLLFEPIDRYERAGKEAAITYRLIFQKFDQSFTETEITAIDHNLEELIQAG